MLRNIHTRGRETESTATADPRDVLLPMAYVASKEEGAWGVVQHMRRGAAIVAVGVACMCVVAGALYAALWLFPTALGSWLLSSDADLMQQHPPIALRVLHYSPSTVYAACLCLPPHTTPPDNAPQTTAAPHATAAPPTTQDASLLRYRTPVLLHATHAPHATAAPQVSEAYIHCPHYAAFAPPSSTPRFFRAASHDKDETHATERALCYAVYAKGRKPPHRMPWESVRHSLRHPRADHTHFRVQPIPYTLFNDPEQRQGEREYIPDLTLEF
eukprot:TRINITY_DN752_c0_g2_i1.p1 TRINITY_DN752_c0_g2~~TRINITY_DN752_c0_g2_i1.p1  ORF type:complete len:272 (+),score=26.93 TRINITY_DN752_c0_g2_i1:58-873(+)